MRIFSFLNVLLLLVIMATHEGAHLDGLLSPAQQKWLHAGAKVMVTGNIDIPTITMIAKAAKEQTKIQMPAAAIVEPAQTFDFAAESRGGNSGTMTAIPASYSAPAAPVVDLDRAFASVLAGLQNS